MSYYPVISMNDYTAVFDSWTSMFDSSATMGATAFSYVMDNYYTPWVNEFKVSKTLAGVQAFIDNDRTYIGAVHRVVMDSSNNGIYVILEGNNGLEYHKIASSQATLIQNPTLSIAEAQNGYFSAVGDNFYSDHAWPIDGPFEFDKYMLYKNYSKYYSNGRWPNECLMSVETYDDAVKICSPCFWDDPSVDPSWWGYVYASWPGKYISVCRDPDSSKNGLYVVLGSTYPEMRLYKLAFDPVNPTVSQTITLAEAENEYWSLFPTAYREVNRKGSFNLDDRALEDHVHVAIDQEYYPCEAFTVFRHFEQAQVWLFSNTVSPSIQSDDAMRTVVGLDSSYAVKGDPWGWRNCYPGKIFAVIDDPDSTKNGLYMVTATITYYTNEYGTDYQRIENYGFIKMQTE